MPQTMVTTAEMETARRDGSGAPRWFVRLGIVAAVSISLVAISLLYYRWYKAEDFESTIIVWAPADWKGAIVRVSGATLAGSELTRELDDEEHPLIRFHVPPGVYRVRVQRNGQTLAERPTSPNLTVRMIWCPFRIAPAATQMGAR